ncbi:hypothetical protein P3342_007156 [Pyrenophora teres f. teres]|nr:hypothetical protein P3342_007156 [Pyrenophora teres f. teres]
MCARLSDTGQDKIANLVSSLMRVAMTAPSLLSRNGHVIPALLPPDSSSLPSTQTNLISEHCHHGHILLLFVVIVTWTSFDALTDGLDVAATRDTREQVRHFCPFCPFCPSTCYSA